MLETTKLTSEELKEIWYDEEKQAKIIGWDFSHIKDRYIEENHLPWDYRTIIKQYLNKDMKLMDYDTGGGEFLLSLNHPYSNTSATEGYLPNVKICMERLKPLGIDIRACDNPAHIPFPDNSFDIVINRHGDLNAPEIKRILKPNGIFITQQVGCDNDRELVEMVLPGTKKPFPNEYLEYQKKVFIDEGFEILKSDEAFNPIHFYDIGAFVWFAHIIEWEFPDFSVDKCFDKLLDLQKIIEKDGKISGTTHRFLLVAKKK